MKKLALLLLFACFSAHSQMQYFKTGQLEGTDLFREYTRLAQLTTDFCVDRQSVVQTSGYVGLRHRNLVVGPVGWVIRVGYYTASTLEALGPRKVSASPGQWHGITWIPGAISSGNIASIEAHYGEASLSSSMIATPGCYRFEVWGDSHSSAAPNTDGLIDVNEYRDQLGSYGHFTVVVLPF